MPRFSAKPFFQDHRFDVKREPSFGSIVLCYNERGASGARTLIWKHCFVLQREGQRGASGARNIFFGALFGATTRGTEIWCEALLFCHNERDRDVRLVRWSAVW
jgi:hypothetical protein